MFDKKKLYKIKYRLINEYATIVSAKNEHQALKKFKKELKYGIIPTIFSIEEIQIKACESEYPDDALIMAR